MIYFGTLPEQYTGLSPLGFQQIAAPAAATALTVTARARVAAISAGAGALRLRDDGTDPTAAIGLRLLAGTSCYVDGASLNKLKVIQEAASTAEVAYYG